MDDQGNFDYSATIRFRFDEAAMMKTNFILSIGRRKSWQLGSVVVPVLISGFCFDFQTCVGWSKKMQCRDLSLDPSLLL